MARKSCQTSPRLIVAADRKARVLRLRLAGKTFREIGKRVGISAARAAIIVKESLAERRAETTQDAGLLLELELLKLDQIERELVPLIVGQARKIRAEWAAYEVTKARWLADRDAAKARGQEPPPEPDEPRQLWTLRDVLLAIDRNLKVAERRARLLGLDNPKPIEVDLGDGLDPIVAGRLMAAFARETGIGEPTARDPS